ncbi:MAG: glycosyltransferase family 39 protein [Paenacidovorax caeni]
MPERAALWAAASLLLIPAMGWESLRDLTQPVLLTCLVAATVGAVAPAAPARPAGFALLGLLLGLGMLSKYSFALFAAVLGGALLSLPAGQALLRERGAWWLPVLAALLVVLPHGLWLLRWRAPPVPPWSGCSPLATSTRWCAAC